MIRRLDRQSPPALLLVLVALYFSQIYPLAHVHHSHAEGNLPFEISVHPIDFDPDQVPGHHGDEDHHHSYDRHFANWLVVRGLKASLTLQPETSFIVSTEDFPSLNINPLLSTESDRGVVSDQATSSASGPRSPPQLT